MQQNRGKGKIMRDLYRSLRSWLFLPAAFLILLLSGCYATATTNDYQYGTTTLDSPVIERTLAAESIAPGTTWRVYLWVTDPNKDISMITYAVEQPGAADHTPGHLRVKPGADGRLEGYLYMNTVSMAHDSGWQMWYTVRITVEDTAGNRSLPRLFTVYFNGESQGDVRGWERAQLASLGLAEPPSMGSILTELAPIGSRVGAAGGPTFGIGGP